MVRIFSDTQGTGDFVIQTTAVDVDTFIAELAEAMDVAVTKANDGGMSALGILNRLRKFRAGEQVLSLLVLFTHLQDLGLDTLTCGLHRCHVIFD